MKFTRRYMGVGGLHKAISARFELLKATHPISFPLRKFLHKTLDIL